MSLKWLECCSCYFNTIPSCSRDYGLKKGCSRCNDKDEQGYLIVTDEEIEEIEKKKKERQKEEKERKKKRVIVRKILTKGKYYDMFSQDYNY